MHPQVQYDEDTDGSPLQALARCNDGTGQWTEIFFSEDLYDIARAKHLCSGCTLREACLEQAVAEREPAGVWGGELFLNGHVVALKRRRGRPPKNRPAEVMVIDGEEVVVVPAIGAPQPIAASA
jgi:WhiB family redox-sensing transcriptional regulator